jgi:hypothetical protein
VTKTERPVARWIGAIGAAALLASGVAATAQAAPVEHDGAVLSKENEGKRSFRIRDDESGTKRRFRVNARTQFERIPGGFRGLEREMVISVNGVRRDNGRLVARFVERERHN